MRIALKRWTRSNVAAFRAWCVEVYRDAAPDASAAFGYRYRSVTRLVPPAAVVPLAFGGEGIAVADLLPWRSRSPARR
jgi:hypothetical protein